MKCTEMTNVHLCIPQLLQLVLLVCNGPKLHLIYLFFLSSGGGELCLKGQPGLSLYFVEVSRQEQIKLLQVILIPFFLKNKQTKKLVPLFCLTNISISIVIKEFQEYVEPEEGYQGSPQRRGPSGQEDENVSLPLGENVLTHNLGIPVLVVCTKVSFQLCLPLWRSLITRHLEPLLYTDMLN